MTYKIIIVEDDFHIAAIHKQYVESIAAFEVMYTAKTGSDILHYLAQSEELPQLILLDMYIPDVVGTELVENIKRHYPLIAIIMITAAKDVATIKKCKALGVFDYLLKPLDFARLQKSLQQYDEMMRLYTEQDYLGQKQIDALFTIAPTTKEQRPIHYPKGIDANTLQHVHTYLQDTKQGITALTLAKELGISRSTARRYLEYLVQERQVETQQQYGEVGRPERRYILL